MIKKISVLLLVAVVGGCIGGVGSGCGGCISSKIEQEVEKRTGLDTGDMESFEDYQLTDADVKKFIRDMPKMEKEFKELDKMMDKPGMGSTPFGPMAGNAKLNAKLEALGWHPPAKFFVVMAHIIQAYSYLSISQELDQAMGNYGEQIEAMQEMLNNPNIPPAQKKQIEQQIKEMKKAQAQHAKQMGEMEEDEVFKHDLKVVKRHKKDLDKIFAR